MPAELWQKNLDHFYKYCSNTTEYFKVKPINFFRKNISNEILPAMFRKKNVTWKIKSQ